MVTSGPPAALFVAGSGPSSGSGSSGAAGAAGAAARDGPAAGEAGPGEPQPTAIASVSTAVNTVLEAFAEVFANVFVDVFANVFVDVFVAPRIEAAHGASPPARLSGAVDAVGNFDEAYLTPGLGT